MLIVRPAFIRLFCLLASALVFTGCATLPPNNIDNICKIFEEKDDWYEEAKAASERWNVPIPAMMSVMRQESAFVATARPPRRWILWIIPGPRPSSAYGYAQVKDGTWYDYEKATGNRFADRDDFEDAIDFIGWYFDGSARTLGISKSNVYGQYLAYHEGRGGFKRKTYKKKKWLIRVANKVDRTAKKFTKQLKKCEDDLESWWFW